MSQPNKKCPACGQENAADAFFCQSCGNDISFIASPVTPNQQQPAPTGRVRTCPRCQNKNDPVLPLCTECGFDIAGEPTDNCKRLYVIIGEQRHECCSGDVLGREGTVAAMFFAPIGTVSRRHVQFTQRDGTWFITVLAGVQNTTKLDNQELPRGVEQSLSAEHRLRLSTQCEVTLRVE